MMHQRYVTMVMFCLHVLKFMIKQFIYQMKRYCNAQETIEQLQIYIFARCPGSTELTAYSSKRMEDVEELKHL